MKRIGIAVLAFGLLASGAVAQEAPSALKTDKDKTSYAIGLEMGKGVKAQGLDVDPALVSQGLKDALTGGKPLLTDEELKAVITGVQAQMKQKQEEALAAEAAENKKAGDAFLTENAKKEGVVTLPSGLQYKILMAGQGKKPAETDTVLCNYKGTFPDGTEFDNSAQTGKPVPFDVKTILPGIKEALLLMPVGSKWQIVIPPSLAYG
ncbi:MAG: FKBP-type peptidyl-prolyl cis-trans isomerase N-terminal domain-containing protein, partial [Candidatus Acidiferrales bacterium]